MNMDGVTAITTRHSVRSYASKPVDKDSIETIIKAGSLAATARNIQPWIFVAVTEKELLQQIADITDHGKFLSGAPAGIVVFCEETKYYLEDGCAATQNILVAANAYGLGTCWIAGDKKPYCETVRELLKVPEGYKLISIISLGHPEGEVNAVSKKPVNELIHWNRYSRD